MENLLWEIYTMSIETDGCRYTDLRKEHKSFIKGMIDDLSSHKLLLFDDFPLYIKRLMKFDEIYISMDRANGI